MASNESYPGGRRGFVSLKRLSGNPKVEHVADERAIGNGVIVTLKQGWTFSPGEDNRVRGEDTVSAMTAAMRDVRAYAGPFDP